MHGFLKEELWKLSGNWVEGTSRLTTWQLDRQLWNPLSSDPPSSFRRHHLETQSPPPPSALLFPESFYKAAMVRYGQKQRGAQKTCVLGTQAAGAIDYVLEKILPTMHWKACSGDVTWSMCAAVSSLSSGAAANIVLWAFVWARRHSNRRTNKQISRRHLLRQIKVHLPCRGAAAARPHSFCPNFLSYN